jgi:type IV pilus assembly protein PilW
MSFRNRRLRPGSASSGFTLIELMVALLLGLIVIAGVISVFLANQRTYRTNEALGDVQDSSRVAFELMARDIRQASLTGCDNSGRVANVLNQGPAKLGTASAWWATWDNTASNAVHGYDSSLADGAVTGRVAGTDSLQLIGVTDIGATVSTNTTASAQFTVNGSLAGVAAGDVLVVCDPNHAAIFQATAVAGTTITYASGTGTTGNCSTGIGYPASCSVANNYQFKPNTLIAKLSSVDWYVGTNAAGGSSLFRVGLENKAGKPTPTAEEMVRGVSGMQLTYHVLGASSFVDASVGLNWGLVDAVRAQLTLQSSDQTAGVDVKPITRSFTTTTTLRNRVQ